MNVNNLIKVTSTDDESTGYFFQSYDEAKSFIIATKHGVCDQKLTCKPYKSKIINCCRDCLIEFDLSKVELSNRERKLKFKKIYYENNKDIVLIEVSENAQNKLKINTEITSDKYFAYGFIKDQKKITRLILDYPQVLDTKVNYNIYSDPTPDLEEKKESYFGISGSLIFTSHEENPVAKGLIIENGSHNDLIAEDLSNLDFKRINDFFECMVFDITLFEIKLKNNLNEHFKIIHKNKVSDELELVLYAPKKQGYPHYDLRDICSSIAHEFYQIFMPKGGNINFLPYKAIKLILDHSELEPINKLLSARVAETYLNAPHLYSTSLNDKLYHHTHYFFINDSFDIAVSFYCGNNLLDNNIVSNIENIISNANNYQFNQKLLLERSFLDQNLEQDICDKIFDILFNFEKRISNFCLVFTLSMELFFESDFTEVDDYIVNIVNEACKKIDITLLRKLKYGLNLHVIIIPINEENEITATFLKDINNEG
ncbi:hypothetical protein [Acinetobacter baumannii]|uniref:hypothetical protein n=1 Tax=Acinetobacter baumannii TaxID=470 RepID=UPI0013B74008|nr:hypothetical protein [Acinetobacter baumannii]NDX19127.1 hypothetical protein [Acinetobacter baumannii]NDX36425.1 hypothetical protein [Acinetobacter baumannii]